MSTKLLKYEALTIGIFPRDQLLCDKGKLGCNESSFVGHIIVVFDREHVVRKRS